MKQKKLFKSIDAKMQDIDEGSNTVRIYYAAFGNKDSYEDIIVPSAFNKSIKERGPVGMDLIYHFKNHTEEVSKPSELTPDSYGLLATVPFPNTTKGRDTLEEFKFGMWKYASIGYKTINEERKSSYNELQELYLFEGSHVLWPANEKAVYVDLKSVDKLNYLRSTLGDDEITRIYEQMLQKSIATDEYLKSIEKQLEELKSTTAPEHKATTEPDLQDYANVINSFLN